MSASRNSPSALDRSAAAIPMLAVTFQRRRAGSAQCERLLKYLLDAISGPFKPALQGVALCDHDELVATETSQRVGSAHDRVEPLGYETQKLIARVAAERFVDALEVVQADHQHGCRRSIAPRATQHALGAVKDQGPVRQPRQLIVRARERDVLIYAPALAVERFRCAQKTVVGPCLQNAQGSRQHLG